MSSPALNNPTSADAAGETTTGGGWISGSVSDTTVRVIDLSAFVGQFVRLYTAVVSSFANGSDVAFFWADTNSTSALELTAKAASLTGRVPNKVGAAGRTEWVFKDRPFLVYRWVAAPTAEQLVVTVTSR